MHLVSARNLVLPVANPGWILWIYALAFLPYAAISFRAYRHPNTLSLPWILGAAIVLRVGLSFLSPVFSDDLYRYVWEGRVFVEGFNPFVFAPASEALAHLRDASIWPLINHKEIPTIYPPFAQYLFALNAVMGGGLALQKLLFLAVEAALGLLVWRRCSLTDAQKVGALVLYALNPLVIVETAWSGHLDVIAWMPALAAIVVWKARVGWKDVVLTGALLGFSIGAKFLGLFALGIIVSQLPWGRARLAERLAVTGVALGLVLVSYLPFMGAQEKLFSGFGSYAASWRSNDGVFRANVALTTELLNRWASDEDRMTPGDVNTEPLFRFQNWDDFYLERGWTKEWEGKVYPNTSFAVDQVALTVSKLVGALLLLMALLWVVLVERRLLPKFAILMGVLLFVAPTVHPWYVAWLVPFAAITRQRWALAFSGLSLLGYAAWYSSAIGGPWAMPWGLALLEFGVVGLIALLWAGRER